MPLAFQCASASAASSLSTRPTISSTVRKPSLAMCCAHLLGDEEEEVDHVLGLAREARAQHRVLRGDAHRAGIQVALAHHDAAHRDQRRGGESEFLGAQQRGDHHVAAGLQLAVGLHADAAAQIVQQQHLLRFREAKFPRQPRMLDRTERRCARAAGVAGDQHHVGVRLGNARGHRAHARLPPPASPRCAPSDSRSSGRRSAAPGLRSNRCRDAAAAKSTPRRESNAAFWR